MSDEPDAFLQRADAAWSEFNAAPARAQEIAWCQEYFALMYAIDQEARSIYLRLLDRGDEDARKRFAEEVAAIDARHREGLAAWLASHDWPTRSQYGAETCEHAWMIAVHGDRDPAFMKRVLSSMSDLLADGEVNPVHYAAIADRIELAEGRPQRFGMFYHYENGERVLYPVDAPEGLEQRRHALGLGDASFHR